VDPRSDPFKKLLIPKDGRKQTSKILELRPKFERWTRRDKETVTGI